MDLVGLAQPDPHDTARRDASARHTDGMRRARQRAVSIWQRAPAARVVGARSLRAPLGLDGVFDVRGEQDVRVRALGHFEGELVEVVGVVDAVENRHACARRRRRARDAALCRRGDVDKVGGEACVLACAVGPAARVLRGAHVTHRLPQVREDMDKLALQQCRREHAERADRSKRAADILDQNRAVEVLLHDHLCGRGCGCPLLFRLRGPAVDASARPRSGHPVVLGSKVDVARRARGGDAGCCEERTLPRGVRRRGRHRPVKGSHKVGRDAAFRIRVEDGLDEAAVHHLRQPRDDHVEALVGLPGRLAREANGRGRAVAALGRVAWVARVGIVALGRGQACCRLHLVARVVGHDEEARDKARDKVACAHAVLAAGRLICAGRVDPRGHARADRRRVHTPIDAFQILCGERHAAAVFERAELASRRRLDAGTGVLAGGAVLAGQTVVSAAVHPMRARRADAR